MASQGGAGGSSRRRYSIQEFRKPADINATTNLTRNSVSISRPPMGLTGERTVKRLRLSKALTVPENSTIYEACRRMAARRVDALLLTDSNALLSGILTDKDIATRVVANEVNIEETPVSKVMTRNPTFILSDTLAVEALQKMVQGKFRHLPVVEKGEVIGLLDIAKCLYDAIARMERASEKGKAIAAAVESVEKNWGPSVTGPSSLIETLRERLFRPFLSTLINENSKVVIVAPTDTVLMAAKKMVEFHSSCAVVTIDNKPKGILTSKDFLMRVIGQNLSPETTLVEKVGSTAEIDNEATSTMMQKFWDSTMALEPTDDDDDTRSESSWKASEAPEAGRSHIRPSSVPKIFSFKIEDTKGGMHRFHCETKSLTNLIASIIQRVGTNIDKDNLPHILYEDEDHDKIILASDGDLEAAVEHAKALGWKGLRLHLDYSGTLGRRGSGSGSLDQAHMDAWKSAYSKAAAGAALATGLGILAYLKRAGN